MKRTLLAVALAPLCFQSNAFAAEATPDEVMVVTANRFSQPLDSVLAPTSIITRDDIDLIQANTMIDIVRMLPGVEVASNGGRGQNASIFVRGTNSSHVLVLIDGVRMNKQTVGSVDFNQIPVNQIERIEFIRGPRAAIYGSEAIGGVINIITQAQFGDRRHRLSAGAGSRDYYSGGWDSSFDIGSNSHLKVVAGYETDGGYNVHPVAGNEGDDHGFEGQNALLGYQHRFSDLIEAYANLRWYQNDVEYDSFGPQGEQGVLTNTWLENKSFDGGLKYQRDVVQSAVSLAYSTQDNYDFYYSCEFAKCSKGNPISFTGIEQYNASWITSYSGIDSLHLNAGIDWRREGVTDDSISFGSPSAGAGKERDNWAAFATASYEINTVTLEGSLRNDDNEQFGNHTTWLASAGWDVVDNYRLIASVGTAFIAPNFFQLYYPFGGNSNLKAEESTNYEVGVEGLTGAVDWRLSVYQNEIDNLIEYDGAATTPEKYFNVAEVEIKGVELELGFDTGFLQHQVSLEYLDPKDKVKQERLVRRAKQKAKWQMIAPVTDQVDFSVRYLYHGDRLEIDGKELASYSLWDVAATYRATSQLELKARIDNLLDKDYETARGYPSSGTSAYFNAVYNF